MNTPRVERILTTSRSQADAFQANAEHIRAGIFGQLIRLAVKHLDVHHSDLYHDAVWINDTITGPTTFYFAVRSGGTHIGHDKNIFLGQPIQAHLWQVQLVETDGRWDLITISLPNDSRDTAYPLPVDNNETVH